MRIFWAIVLLLLLAGGAAAFFAGPSRSAANGTVVAQDRFTTDIGYTQPATVPAAAQTQPADPAKAPVEPPAPPAPVDFSNDLDNAIKAAVKVNQPADAKAKADTGVPFDLPTTPAFPADKMIPAKAVKVGGEIVIDGKFHVKGSGTAADPYVVPFDLLMSAQDAFDPRKGLSKMPQRVAFLHEKHVKLIGYVAFPLTSTDPKEMLVMFNQWDGCCIGVPPTAYDAVETKLAHAVVGDDKFITFGSTTGIFKVDPYVDNGWLLGLYTMEAADLTDGHNEPMAPKSEDEN